MRFTTTRILNIVLLVLVFYLLLLVVYILFLLFFFNDTATTEIYTLSLHDALPISLTWLALSGRWMATQWHSHGGDRPTLLGNGEFRLDRKSTRLNSSHPSISYAVFCLKKKKKQQK